jgi:quinol monooxygenase YgiN
MFGLIVSILVLPENREALLAALDADPDQMPGCAVYMVGPDHGDESVVRIAEVWESELAHQEWRESDHGQQMAAQAKHWIIGFAQRDHFEASAGHGYNT